MRTSGSTARPIRKGETCELEFFCGIGYEEVAAATSAKEIMRRGWEWEYNRTAEWLEKRAFRMAGVNETYRYPCRYIRQSGSCFKIVK